ncbi:MAG: hypothetical protein ABGY05_06325 [Pseudomonadota bacterium]
MSGPDNRWTADRSWASLICATLLLGPGKQSEATADPFFVGDLRSTEYCTSVPALAPPATGDRPVGFLQFAP